MDFKKIFSKNKIENTIFSNKTKFIKNRRIGNKNSNNGSGSGNSNGSGSGSGSGNSNGSGSGSWFSSWFKSNNKNSSNGNGNGNHSNLIILWILLYIIIAVIICYLTIMTTKYLTTKCLKKRSWFNYIFRFCYKDVCLKPDSQIINNIHYTKNLPNMHKVGSAISADMHKVGSAISADMHKKGTEHHLENNSDMHNGGTAITTDIKKLSGKEQVFHIANQDYTYEQAKCKCSSYNAKLASYSQIIDAYNEGAEWCSYGWSNGQTAYYPTQKCNSIKKECGKPGINGGFFADPYLKFGINCYGKKPKGSIIKMKDPICEKQNYCEMPQNYGANNRLDTDDISPFNQNKWSQ